MVDSLKRNLMVSLLMRSYGRFAAALFIVTCAAGQTPPRTHTAGRWTIAGTVKGFPVDATCDLTLTDLVVIGTCTDSLTKQTTVLGSVQEGTLSWTFPSRHEDGPISLVFVGKIGDNGATMAGEIHCPELLADGTFTAKRTGTIAPAPIAIASPQKSAARVRDPQVYEPPLDENGGPLRPVGNDVVSPICLLAREPEFTDASRKAHLSGNVLIYLQVDADGRPSHVRVLQGLGSGLDENAVEAVKSYKFKPAMQNGKPIPVVLKIIVGFYPF